MQEWEIIQCPNYPLLVGKIGTVDAEGEFTHTGQTRPSMGGFATKDGGVTLENRNRTVLKPVAVAPASDRGAGLKFDGGKPRWSLLMQGCASALEGVVKVLTFGAKKYAAHSWREVKGGDERYRDALYRHLHEIEKGELVDPESDESHWAHVACNALFLAELAKAKK